MLAGEPRVAERAISPPDPIKVIGIRPIGRVTQQPSFDRVLMDIATQVQQVGIALNAFGLVPALKQTTDSIKAFVDCFGA